MQSTLVRYLRPAHTRLLVFLGLLSVIGAAYALYAASSQVHPGSPVGITFGSAAALLMLACACLGIRRRRMARSRIPAQVWVRTHVYGGALFFVMVLMHTGFALPRGALTTWLFWTSAWVTFSGFIGVALQKWVPRFITAGLHLEVVYERIPEMIREMQLRALELVKSSSVPVQNYYRKSLAAQLSRPRARLIYVLDISGGVKAQSGMFAYLRKCCAPAEHGTIDALELLYRTKLELDAHYTLQGALRMWLALHLPAAVLLMILTALHLFTTAYY